jgi:hypothetical protein
MVCEGVEDPDATGGTGIVCTEEVVDFYCYQISCPWGGGDEDPFPEDDDCSNPNNYYLPECSFEDCGYYGTCDDGGEQPQNPCAEYGPGAYMAACGCIGGTTGLTYCSSTADHSLPNKNKLPPNGTADKQVGKTCVFKAMEWISKYYGGNSNVNTIMEDYRVMKGLNHLDLITIINTDGVHSSDLNNLLSLVFEHTTTNNLFTSVNNGHPVIATISDGNGGGHEVMITGYNNNGTMEYFDPQTGLYNNSLVASQFFNVREITGLKP